MRIKPAAPPSGRGLRDAPFDQDQAGEGPRWTWHRLAPLLVVALVAGLVAGFFLNLYRAGNLQMPVGYDVARYLDQTALVASRGIRQASHVILPPPSRPLTSRVAFPVTVLSLSRLLGVSTFKFAAVMPIAAIAAGALAAGALVTSTLRRGVVTFTVVALIVGTCTAMVRLLVPEAYVDNIVTTALFLGALVPLYAFVHGGRGLLPAAVLLGVVALAHPGFYAFNVAILGLTGAAFVPRSWRRWRREGAAFFRTEAARIGLVLVASAILPLVMIYGILGTRGNTPWFSHQVFAAKLSADVHLYRFPLTVPLALAGLLVLALRTRGRRVPSLPGDDEPPGEPPRRDGSVGDGSDRPDARRDGGAEGARFLLTVCLAWGAATFAGLVAFWMGRPLPVHRFLAFLIPMPLLGALAILALAGLVGTARGLGAGAARLGAAAVLLVGVAGLGAIGYDNMNLDIAKRRGVEPVTLGKVRDAATAEDYLDRAGVPASRPVVFVITDRGRDPASAIPLSAYILRTVLDPDRVEHAYFYVGEPSEFLTGRPTLVAGDTRGFNAVSKQYWGAVSRVLPRDPVAVMLASYHRGFEDEAGTHPDLVVAPGVIVLKGPRPASPLPQAEPSGAPTGKRELLIFGVAGLAILALVGWGWVLAAFPRSLRPFESLALSLSAGIAAVIVVGTVLDVAGLRLGGAGGPLAAPLAGAAGWVLGGLRLARERLPQ